jgi:hypothetical protein
VKGLKSSCGHFGAKLFRYFQKFSKIEWKHDRHNWILKTLTNLFPRIFFGWFCVVSRDHWLWQTNAFHLGLNFHGDLPTESLSSPEAELTISASKGLHTQGIHLITTAISLIEYRQTRICFLEIVESWKVFGICAMKHFYRWHNHPKSTAQHMFTHIKAASACMWELHSATCMSVYLCTYRCVVLAASMEDSEGNPLHYGLHSAGLL